MSGDQRTDAPIQLGSEAKHEVSDEAGIHDVPQHFGCEDGLCQIRGCGALPGRTGDKAHELGDAKGTQAREALETILSKLAETMNEEPSF